MVLVAIQASAQVLDSENPDPYTTIQDLVILFQNLAETRVIEINISLEGHGSIIEIGNSPPEE